MRGYWHFPALGITTSFLAVMLHHEWLIGLFFLWTIWLNVRNRLGILPILVSLAATLLSFFYLPDPEQSAPDIPYNGMKEITGEITSPVRERETKIEFTLKDDITGTDFMITYFGDERDELYLKYGASCRVDGTPELPESSKNPGQFDYRDYLASQGIHYQIILDSPRAITCTGSSFMQTIYQLRFDLTAYVRNRVSPQTAAWLNALVLGDDTQISEEIKNLFQRWNLTHLLAISGLHVGLVVGFIYLFLVKFAGITKEKAQWTVMIFLPVYALLAGGEPSVLRASAMVLLFLVAGRLNWKWSATDVLSIVFIALICVDRYIVYQLGFQLSFCVTFGLLLSKDWLAQTEISFFSILKISFIAQMLILPLQVVYFFTFHPLSILFNTVAVPYFTLFVIPLMFTTLLLTPVAGFLLPIFDALFVSIHDVFINLMQHIDQAVYYPFFIGSFPFLAVILYYIILIMFMMKLEARRQKEAFAWGFCILLLLCLMVMRPYLSPDGKVTMLDIGQGDAFVVELPYRESVILIDAGARLSFDMEKPSENVYQQVIRPYLLSQGIHEIDAIFISHGDTDHSGSLPYIVEDMSVHHVIVSAYYSFSEQVVKAMENTGTKIVRTNTGDELTIGGQHFKILSPSVDNGSPNENSLVLYSVFGGKSWLFTGDIGKDTEQNILRTYPRLSAHVLKVAHHGSQTSSDPSFLQQINPEYGLISVGENNTYGHPHAQVLESLAKGSVTVYRTDENGAVEYHFRGNKGTFSTYLP
ncbi:DNA internalization-related competence protein ComEC/Rec2 [Lentibacillus lipolyticus]|nr:DNA internalization-related competence protein ComEC/Rec2 [Lentibacillus lipolyticus]